MSPELELRTPSFASLIQGMSKTGVLTLPPLPDVALRIGALLRSDDANPPQVADLIRNEPAIAATVMRMANSASFGGLRAVQRVEDAVARLGMRQVAAIVATVAHKGHFESRDPQRHALLRALWDHAVATASAAGSLAGTDGSDGSESFLAGLLHDVGKLAVVKAVDMLAARGQASCTPVVLTELMELLHADLGQHILGVWKLPEPICRIAGHHHDPAPDPTDLLLARVQAANALTRKMGFHPDPRPEIDLSDVPAIERLGIPELELASLMVDVEDELARVNALF